MKIVEIVKFLAKNGGIFKLICQIFLLVKDGPGEDLRSWMKKCSDVASSIVKMTPTPIDDNVVANLRKVVDDDTLWASFCLIIDRLRSDGILEDVTKDNIESYEKLIPNCSDAKAVMDTAAIYRSIKSLCDTTKDVVVDA